MWGGLWATLSLYLCHGRFWGDGRLWFSHRTSFIAHWSTLVQTVPARSSSHLRLRLRLRLILGLGLRLRLRLLCHSSVRHRAALHGGRAVLVGDRLRGVRLRGVRLPSPHRLSVSCGHVGVAIGLLVAALGPPFDGGRLLEGEVGAVGVGLGAAGPPLQGRCGFNPGHVLLCEVGVSLRTLVVGLQTYTKYTLTENSYIHDKGLFLHKQSNTLINGLHRKA